MYYATQYNREYCDMDTSIISTLVHGPHKLPTVYIHIQIINP